MLQKVPTSSQTAIARCYNMRTMPDSKTSVDDSHSEIGVWHGTGRYKYENGEVVDVLKGILQEKALTPYQDTWDRKRLNKFSISLARSRGYARLYASLFFPVNKRSWKELGRRFLWSCRYLLPSLWVAWKEFVPLPFIPDYKNKTATSTIKLARKPQSLFYMFLWGGTDISANYPVLIGIKRGVYKATSSSRFVDLYEERISTPISVHDFTHFEVPREQIVHTQQLVAAMGLIIPIRALEEGDRK